MIDKIYISKIISVLYVKPKTESLKRFYYGPNIPTYELIYKISGENITTFNGNVMHNTPGKIEFLPKCEKAEYYVDIISAGDCIDIYFDTDCPMPDESFIIDSEANKKLKPLFDKIHRLWTGKLDGYHYKCMALFYEILAEIQKPYGGYLPEEKYKKIEKGIEYLHTYYYDSEIDYYMPAELCSISYTYFKKLFSEKFGITPQKYVTKLRIERAKELIITKRYSITEIARMCGFDNVYYFSNVFKKHIGCSPGNFSI